METHTVKPQSAIEIAFNRFFGWVVGLGLAPKAFCLLEVKARKSGRPYAVPVTLVFDGRRRYLVAPRGETQWVKNARITGAVTLKRGSTVERCSLRPVPDGEKPAILKAYLDAHPGAVQRFFPVPAGSPVDAMTPIAARYPVFELQLER